MAKLDLLAKYGGTGPELHRLGEIGAQEARRIVPVDTGRLRASIRYEIEDEELHLQADTPYAGFVEYGTHRQRAQPYLRPAIEFLLQQVEDNYDS